MSTQQTPGFFKLALVLGLLTAIGPFAVDMYLPALPTIENHLKASTATAQATLMVFFIAMGLSQLIYGPLSDLMGRKPPLFGGLILFIIGSIGCALSPNIHHLIFWRFIQGLGGAAGSVIGRAVVRDFHTGTQAAKLMSLLMLIFSVSPILAPVTGSLLLQFGDWRDIFWMTTAAACAGIVLATIAFPESTTPHSRKNISLKSAFKAYEQLFKDKHYLGFVMIVSFGISSFFCFLSSSSFVLINYYHLSPAGFSAAFGCNAAIFFGTAQLNGLLCQRFGIARVIRLGLSISLPMNIGLFLYFFFGGTHLYVLLTMLFISAAGMSMVVPTATVMAMDRHGHIAGAASALLGTIQGIISGSVVGLMGIFNDSHPLPMVTGMALCLSTAFGFSLIALRKAKH